MSPSRQILLAFSWECRSSGTSVFAAHNGRNWRPAHASGRMYLWIDSVSHLEEDDMACTSNSISPLTGPFSL